MGPAQAVRSSVNDMLAYGSALLAVQEAELVGQKPPPENPLQGAAKQLSDHISKNSGPPSSLLQENAYGFGMDRIQLPQSLAGIGCNGMFVKEMPQLVPGPGSPHGGLSLVHTSSLAGYTSMLGLLPEYDNAVVFAIANAIGLDDPSGWTLQLIVETIINSKNKADYVALASEAATNHARREIENAKDLNDVRRPDTKPRPSLDAYVGDYVGLGGMFKLGIRQQNTTSLGGGLEVRFQGLESQAWPLTHYEHDTFTWLQPFNGQARRARFNLAGPGRVQTQVHGGRERRRRTVGEIDRVCWIHEPGLGEKEQYFLRQTKGMVMQL